MLSLFKSNFDVSFVLFLLHANQVKLKFEAQWKKMSPEEQLPYMKKSTQLTCYRKKYVGIGEERRNVTTASAPRTPTTVSKSAGAATGIVFF